MLITSFWRIPAAGIACMYGFCRILLCINYFTGFPGGPAEKSLSASAGERGLVPGPGRSLHVME